MPIYDQFDIGTNLDFSGSYTDNVVSIFSGSGIAHKKFIGSKTEKLTHNDFNFDLKYSDFLNYVSGAFKGKNSNFQTFYDEREIMFDSLLPSPVDYHIANNAKLFYIRDQVTQNIAINARGFGASSSFSIKYNPGTRINSTNGVGDTGGTEDGSWAGSFPFEIKYKNLIKLKRPTNALSKFYNISASIANFLDVFSVAVGATASINLFNGNISSICGRYPKINDAPEGFDDEQIVITLSETSKSWAQFTSGSHFKGRAATIPNIQVSPDIENTYKMYFGRGRKEDYIMNNFWGGVSPRKYYLPVGFQDYILSQQSRGVLESSPAYICFGPIVSGWKYGIFNAIPTKTNMIFRRNHFGHHRDMLEQRLFSKFDNGKSITGSPVTVTFISGSDSYVTATNDSTLNIKDSGIFRKEYTSGRPFADDL